ncbi:MAG: hypothetical protein U0Q18_04415 [Bryobacteraceae bacterium]
MEPRSTLLLAIVALIGRQGAHAEADPALTRSDPQTASQTCSCFQRPPAGALKPVEGEATIRGWRLVPQRGELTSSEAQGGLRWHVKLPSLNAHAQLLGILASGSSLKVVTGWAAQLTSSSGDATGWVQHFQVFQSNRRSARLLSRFTLKYECGLHPPMRTRSYVAPDGRDSSKIIIENCATAISRTVYLLRSDNYLPEELFETPAYDFLDLNRDGVYELLSWGTRPNDRRCKWGMFSMYVNPDIYLRSGQTYYRAWPPSDWSRWTGMWENPTATVQIMAVLTDVDGDGTPEIVALTDQMKEGDRTPPDTQRLAAYRLEGESFHLLTQTRLGPPRVAYWLCHEPGNAGVQSFQVWMADPGLCGNPTGPPEDPRNTKVVYIFREGRFDRTGTCAGSSAAAVWH